MLLSKSIGQNGRLGNQLFQIAFLYYLSKKLGLGYAIPKWPYQDYFQYNHPIDEGYPVDYGIKTKDPRYSEDFIEQIQRIKKTTTDFNQNIDISGFFQSVRYPIENNLFVYNRSKEKQVWDKVRHLFNRLVVGVHIRKGDYISNNGYVNLSPSYYLDVIQKRFSDTSTYVILVFTDDYEYAHASLSHLPHVVFFPRHYSDIESLMALSMCNKMILANSTFSWWAYKLSQINYQSTPEAYAPTKIYDGHLAQYENTDFWPLSVNKVLYEKPYYDLSDVTFIIPVQRDSKDREENLKLTIKYLKHYFNTNIIVGEISNYGFFKGIKGVRYEQFKNYDCFHRTKILNEMTKMSTTPIVMNWDADVLMPPHQIYDLIKEIRDKGGVGYPYDGRFVRMDREFWYPLLSKHINLIEGMEGQRGFANTYKDMDQSYGGAFAFDKEDYSAIGLENENFISHAPEDKERYLRSLKLEIPIYRSSGCLYHIDHFMGENSSGKYKHKFVASNRQEIEKIISMTTKELNDYVKTWYWGPNGS